MKMELKKPCLNCPFRTDIKPYLTEGRVLEIEHELVENQKHFICHKTLPKFGARNGREQHCAGALIILEKMNKPNQMMRWYERVKLYDRNKLDMNSPVYSSFKQLIKRIKDEHNF